MFKVIIKTDDDAVQNDTVYELERLLYQVKRGLDAGTVDGRLIDSNGNTVGMWILNNEYVELSV